MLKDAKDEGNVANTVSIVLRRMNKMIDDRRSLYGRPVRDSLELFEIIDRDREGKIDRGELQRALNRLGQQLNMGTLDALVQRIGADDDGQIGFENFNAALEEEKKLQPSASVGSTKSERCERPSRKPQKALVRSCRKRELTSQNLWRTRSTPSIER